jgi:hypothetical protein
MCGGDIMRSSSLCIVLWLSAELVEALEALRIEFGFGGKLFFCLFLGFGLQDKDWGREDCGKRE